MPGWGRMPARMPAHRPVGCQRSVSFGTVWTAAAPDAALTFSPSLLRWAPQLKESTSKTIDGLPLVAPWPVVPARAEAPRASRAGTPSSHRITARPSRQSEWSSSRPGGEGLDDRSFWRNTLHAMAGRAKHVVRSINATARRLTLV